MNEILKDFYTHKLLIDITGASKEELDELESVIDCKYVDNCHLSSHMPANPSKPLYLHCREKEKGVTRSDYPKDYATERPIEYINYMDLIGKDINISEEEIEKLYK